MQWKRQGTLCVFLFFGSDCLAGNAAGDGGPGSHVDLTVRFYNYAAVPDGTLSAAQQQFNTVFREAGIAVTWVECPVSEAVAQRITCPQVHEPPYVVLRIVPLSMASVYPHPPGELGLATYPDAYIFFDRLHEFCNHHRVPEAAVLGKVMAHEVGHLLLGAKSHSAGIMSALLLADDDLTRNKRCQFTESQAKQMRARIRAINRDFGRFTP